MDILLLYRGEDRTWGRRTALAFVDVDVDGTDLLQDTAQLDLQDRNGKE